MRASNSATAELLARKRASLHDEGPGLTLQPEQILCQGDIAPVGESGSEPDHRRRILANADERVDDLVPASGRQFKDLRLAQRLRGQDHVVDRDVHGLGPWKLHARQIDGSDTDFDSDLVHKDSFQKVTLKYPVKDILLFTL